MAARAGGREGESVCARERVRVRMSERDTVCARARERGRGKEEDRREGGREGGRARTLPRMSEIHKKGPEAESDGRLLRRAL